MTARQILVTAALPYANAPIHIGYLLEAVQTDIWVRFQKLRGNRCIYLCADDTHGTAIMIRAQKEGRSEESLISEVQAEHVRDLTGFQIKYENYGSTHSPENRARCAQIWASIRQSGLVKEANVEQLYDTKAQTFLADRFVRGTCPNCKSKDQPGDNCSVCGHHYNPTDLIDPISAISGTRPEVRSAPHLFIQLEPLHGFLTEWTQTGDHLQSEVANYLKGHFLGEPLRDWDVSRPAPYFGFEIPDSPGNYWYVWFDAPIGYMASLEQWCKKSGEKFDDWWPRIQDSGARSQESKEDSGPEIHHFIGKDITYFHTLFWPGMLKTAGYKLPAKVHIHGFLTVGGEKMSKSKGTFIKAATYLKHLNPAYLRYYYATKLGPRIDDFDFNIDEFVTKVNSDLVGKVVNLASRTARFVEQAGLSASYPEDGGLFKAAAGEGDSIAEAYEACDYNRAMRQIMALADAANQYVDAKAPWRLNKDPANGKEVQRICTISLNLFRQLVIYLAPVLPELARQAGELLNDPITNWEQSKKPLVGTRVNKFQPLLTRVEPAQVQAMIEDSKSSEPVGSATATAGGGAAGGAQSADGPEALAAEPLAAECTIDDFTKVDLRVARILTAEEVPDARKLLKLTLGLGGDTRKTVFAGIKKAYSDPSKLVGRLVICVANLQPRQMKFGLSEGMVCAAGSGGDEVFLLSPDSGAKPGQRVH